MSEQHHDEYNEYLKEYRDELLKTYEKNQDSFEKQLSYLSAGTIGASFLFIEHVIHDINKAQLLWLLFSSWILLSGTLIMNIISHKLSSKIQYKTILEIDNGEFSASKANKRNAFQHNINTVSLTCLIIGILLFLLYSAINLHNMNNDTSKPPFQQPNTETGQKSSVPGPARDVRPTPTPTPAPAPNPAPPPQTPPSTPNE